MYDISLGNEVPGASTSNNVEEVLVCENGELKYIHIAYK